MAFNVKKMSTGQLMMLGLGSIVAFMILAALVISVMRAPKPAPPKRASIDTGPTAADIAIEQLNQRIKDLEERVATNRTATADAFKQTAEAIDTQNQNIQLMDKNNTVTNQRVKALEQARMGMRAVAERQGEAANRPTRRERLAAGSGATSTTQAAAAQQIRLASTPNYQVQATVGDRAWVRTGNEEYSVRPGERLPVTGPLVVTNVSPGGRVSVGIEGETR